MGAAGGPHPVSAAASSSSTPVATPPTSLRDRQAERLLAGIGLAVMAVACFAALDTSTKLAVMTVPVFMGAWFRYTFQAIATTAVLLPLHGPALLRTRHPRYQALRGLLLLGSTVFACFSLRDMPMAEFTAIMMVAPLAITVMAALVLRERVSPLRWTLVAGGFAGTL
ncbi:MAG: DMT family transporter, partial [Xenophilus sp.]